MRKARILSFLGVWVAILPYLGFPSSWKNILFAITGIVLVYISYLLYRDRKIELGGRNVFDNFSENNGFDGEEK